MRIGNWILGIGCCVAVMACDVSKGALDGAINALKRESPQIAAAKKSLAFDLKDPLSVQFRDLQAYPEGVVCGQFNAKNGMGGYVGFSPFVYRPIASTGYLHADRQPSDAEISKWCNDTPDKVLSGLVAEHAKWRAQCDASAKRAENPDDEYPKTWITQGAKGQAAIDAYKAALKSTRDMSCKFAEAATKELDEFRKKTR